MAHVQTLTVSGADVRVGDEFPSLWFLRGGPGVVKVLMPYTGCLDLGAGSQIAVFAGAGFDMTLAATTTYTVQRVIFED